MSGGLRVGARLTAPFLTGTWSVWSAAGDCPGAFFLIPADDFARNSGLKYAVVRAITKRSSFTPELTLIRTDPPTKETR